MAIAAFINTLSPTTTHMSPVVALVVSLLISVHIHVHLSRRIASQEPCAHTTGGMWLLPLLLGCYVRSRCHSAFVFLKLRGDSAFVACSRLLEDEHTAAA